MTTPRRRLIRPAAPVPSDHSLQLQKLRARLEENRRGLTRWLSKLRRAFNAMDKHNRRIARLERQITHLEGG
jgi:hypothetical protein